MSDGLSCDSLPQGPPVSRRPLPGVPAQNAPARPVSMPPTSAPCPPRRSESMASQSRDPKSTKRSRPVITVVDARPMSEVGFRGALKPDSQPNRPDVTMVDQKPVESESTINKRPPPPSRPPAQRQSQNNQEQTDIHSNKPLPEPPSRGIGKPPRPLSMFGKLPAPRKNKTLLQKNDGIENEGFEERNNRLNSLERGVNSNSLIDFDTEVNGNEMNVKSGSHNDTVPDLLSNGADQRTESQRNFDLLSDVQNSNVGGSNSVENQAKPLGIPVFPPGVRGALPPNRGPPPPLPKKSPSVPNLNKISGDATWNRFGDMNPGNSEENDAPVKASSPRMPRKPTIIRPGRQSNSGETTAPVISKDEVDGVDNSGHAPTGNHGAVNRNLISGGVKVFPFQVTKSRNVDEPVSSPAEPEKNMYSQNITSKSKPAPAIKPKPVLMPKPSLRPKPNLAPKPFKRPQSEMIPTHSQTQQDYNQGEASGFGGHVNKEPWQNELNALLESKRRVPGAEKNDARNTEAEKEGNEQLLPTTTKKPGPVRATYRPTIIRAAAKPKERESRKEDNEPVPVISKRFSTSCIDMRSAGDDETVNENTNKLKSRDDLEYKPKQPSPQPRRRQSGPTIIRPKSTLNLTSNSGEDKFINSDNINTGSCDINQVKMPDVLPSRKSSGPPPRPRAPSPVALTRRRSSTGSSEDIELPTPTSPVLRQKKSPPGKPPPPRPASGPKRESIKRHSHTAAKPPPSPAHRKSVANTPQGPHAVAIYDYPAQRSDELSFSAGEVIQLVREVDADWLIGKCHGKEGMFPKNFADVIIPLSEALPEPEKIKPSPDQLNLPTVTTTPATPVNTWDEPKMSPLAQDDVSSGPHCVAMHDYISPETGDLCFKQGAVIKLLEKVGEEWRRGDLYGTVGIFPVTYVNIVEDCPDGKPEEPNKLQIPEPQQHTPQLNTSQDDRHVTALYDFDGQENELTFKAGDVIKVLSIVNDEWLHGEISGQVGNFPANFISSIPDGLPAYKSENQDESSQGFHDNVDHSSETWNSQATNIESLVMNEPSSTMSHLSKPAVLQTAVVLYDFPGQTDGDLPLTAGSTVEIIETIDDDWLRGRIGNNEGIFPANFVETQ